MKKYRVKLNGKEYEVEIEEVTRADNEAAVKGQTQAPVPTQASPADIPVAKAGAGLSIKSPMPGAIIEINVKPGDRVLEGDVLLVLEAMKMLNEIVASQSGTVTQVAVNKGDMVGSGDLLLTIE